MSKSQELSIYEKTFAKSDETDAILVVDGKKLHVNKALLSYHSSYFNALFNSEFKEKSMDEIEIKDLDFEDFATVLSLIQKIPISPKKKKVEELLKVADRFDLPAATHFLDYFICLTDTLRGYKLNLADKYNLDVLLDNVMKLFSNRQELFNYINIDSFSKKTKAAIAERLFELR